MRRRVQHDSDDNGFAEWGGYMAAKKSKLMQQFSEAANNEEGKELNIFQGVSVFVNGYTKPSSEEIKHIMTLYGGIYHHYPMTGENGTKYIIASNLPDSKVKQITKNIKILKPSWITDCVKAEKLLSYKDYLLYTNESKSQPRLDFSKSNFNTEKSDVPADDTSNTRPAKYCRTAVDPNFLTEFYNNSRLHLISTLGAAFKQHINYLRDKTNWEFPARERLKSFIKNNRQFNSSSMNKVIMHIDMDCFFVSVGLRTRPELRGKPVAVTHGRENKNVAGVKSVEESDLTTDKELKEVDSNNSMSEIASCSYEARKAGVKNGMFLGTALKLCPTLKTMPYDFTAYKEVAYVLYDTVALYTLEIEAVSCDEMYVDVTDLLHETGASIDQWASFIRAEIKDQTKCPCSTGFGSNRLQARLATKKAKPDGQYHLKPEYLDTYMLDVEVSELPGVGRSLSNKLTNLGLKTCGDIQSRPLTFLQNEFGNRVGESLYSHCRGIDNQPLNFQHTRKSVSAEVNYGIRFKTSGEVETFLEQLCAEVHSRLLEINMKGKNITLKLMVKAKDASFETAKFMGHGVCDNITKSCSLSSATSDLTVIKREIMAIMRKLSLNPIELRGIGIQISKLEKDTKVEKENVLTKFLQKKTGNSDRDKQTESRLQSENKAVNLNHATGSDQHRIDNNDDQPDKEQKYNIDLHIPEEVTEERDSKLKGTICPVNSTAEADKRNKCKTQPKRPRGRPKKITKTAKFCRPLTSYITTSRTTKNTVQKQAVLNMDPSVLSALPRDIQLEILNDHNKKGLQSGEITEKRIKNQESPKTSTNNVVTINKDEINKNILYELPDDIREEIIKEYSLNIDSMSNENSTCSTTHSLPVNEEPKMNNDPACKTNSNIDSEMLKNMNWEEMKLLFKEWTDTEISPEACDIEIIGHYTYQLAVTRNIELLHKIVKFLYRILSQHKSCDWHRAYKTIISKFQEGMLITYKSRLQAHEKIQCLSC